MGKFGLTLGPFFLGVDTSKGLISRPRAPFSENVESNMPYVVSAPNAKELLGILRNKFTDKSLIELFGSVAEIFAPVDASATRILSGEIQLKKIKTDEVVYDNEKINRLIAGANPLQSIKQVLYELICYEMVTGKSFLMKNTPDTLNRKDYKNLTSLWVLPSDATSLDVEDRIRLFSATKIDDLIKGYILEKGTSNEIFIEPDKVMYRKAPSLSWSSRKLEGHSPLLSASKAISNLIAVYEARGIIYLKRGAMGMWVSSKKDDSGLVALTKNEKLEAADDLDKEYGLNSQRKRTVGLSSVPMTFVKTSMSIQELEPFEETKADAAAIYGVLGVPYELAPKPQGETYSNQMTAEKGFYQNKCIPYGQGLMEDLTRFLGLEAFGYYLSIDYSKIEVLQDNKKDTADIKSKLTSSATGLYKDGAITYNQWLIELGYEPRGPEFDKYINELENIPMAVKIGVQGAQVMQNIVSDPAISEEGKVNMLVLLFGVTEEQARSLLVNPPKPNNQSNESAQ